MKKSNGTLLLSAALALLAAADLSAALQQPVALGSNSTFVALGGTTVTVTGGGTITGDIGISPGLAFVPGVPAVTVKGTIYSGGPVAARAQADLTLAFNDAAGRQTPVIVAGNIGGQTLTPGLYKSTSSLAISSGELTLDGLGDPNAVFIFQIASSLTVTSGRQVILTGGANALNIFWQVGTSATFGTTSIVHGNVLAAVSISVLTGATLNGRALAQSGAVTFDTGGGTSIGTPAPGSTGGGGGPAISVSGIVNDATFLGPVAAGSIAAVFGSNLSVGQSGSSIALPLPTTLAQSSFLISGFAAPMYFASPGQANVQIPWELAGQAQAQMTATVNGTSSAARSFVIAPFAPGIFTVDQSGTGQGTVLVSATAQLASAATPATRGNYVSIYCTGLGAVSNRPASGAPAASVPLSFSSSQPTVTIGGSAATVSYSGLAPTLVGLYQINALVPTGITAGNNVPLSIRIGGIDSNTVTIAVK
ncbi:MAG: hypothetical protein JWN34_3993 [Bryobacterales bacterium]|jgi:uncharacterized protein (TIGR03437 family)|nr:hypothetical protein [Bryobacterales bacterium]